MLADLGTVRAQGHTIHGQDADFHRTLRENEDGGSQDLTIICHGLDKN
jgi:hypothetical protein